MKYQDWVTKKQTKVNSGTVAREVTLFKYEDIV